MEWTKIETENDLPAESGRYWVYNSVNQIDDMYWTGTDWLDMSNHYEPADEIITHWMPFEYPEPPE